MKLHSRQHWRDAIESEDVFAGDTRPHFTGWDHPGFDWVWVAGEMRIAQDEEGDEPCHV
jgi:hypothetical protein